MHKAVLAALVAGAGMAPAPALADAREDVVNAMTRCASLSDDRQWLDCHYGAAQPMRSQLAPAGAGGPTPAFAYAHDGAGHGARRASRLAGHGIACRRAHGSPPMPKRSGMFDIFGGSEVVSNTPIQSYQVTAKGFTVTLPDGQVWKQTEDDASKLPVDWSDAASSMRVTITQGALHSFNLVMGDENQHHKVTRIR